MMARVTRSVRVTIAGTTFSLRTDASRRYVRELASFVDARMDAARHSGRAVTSQATALLTTMTIADELFQSQRDHAELKRRVREKSNTILRYLRAEEAIGDADPARDEATESIVSQADDSEPP